MTPSPNRLSEQAIPAPSLAVYRRIVTVFFLLTVAVIGLVLYFAYSRATVVVLSKQEEVRSDFVIDIAKNPTDGDVKGTIAQASDTMSSSFPSTSLASVDAHAEGTVHITSTLSRAQTLVATTRLLTADNVMFRLKKTVTVPANGGVDAEVFADQPGDTGDVGMASFTIPGLNPDVRKHFQVQATTALTGGTKNVHMVTKEDVDGALGVLKDKLTKELSEKLRAQAAADHASTSGEIVTAEMISQSTDVPIGTGADEFRATLTLRLTGVYYDAADFKAKAEARLKQAVPFDRSLVTFTEDTDATTVEKTDVAGGRANIHVFARGPMILSTSSPQLAKAKLVGITTDAATVYLQHLDGVSSASVRVSPFWGRMPNVEEHISVEVR